ncbi:MAG: GNAT family N-acetyltransferase [Limisphaerales bacterium]
MYIRSFRIGDEHALHEVFYSAIHRLASKNYTPEQIEAWAPLNFDQKIWASRMQGIQPFVVEHAGQIVAYADVQANGCIDHFFVAASHARQGIGSTLMNHIHDVANVRSIAVLSSDVSLTAQPFFEKCGFTIIEQRSPVIRGVVVPNALMHKELAPTPSIERMSLGEPGAASHIKRWSVNGNS